MSQIEARLQELGIELPPLPPPAGNYVSYVQSGNLLFLAGSGPSTPGWPPPLGQAGVAFTPEASLHPALRDRFVRVPR